MTAGSGVFPYGHRVACKIVDALPFGQFSFQIDATLAAEKLVEFLLVRAI